jgi:hypothetical protein
MQLSRERLRIKFDQQSERGAKDVITGGDPTAWRATDMQFELLFSVTIGDGDEAVNNVLNISNWQTIELTVKDATDRGGATLMRQTIGAADMHAVVAENDWDSGADQHCVILFAAAETRLDMGGRSDKNFFLVVRITTVDGLTFTAGFATFKLLSDGVSGETSTPPIGSSMVPAGTPYSGAGAYVLNGLVSGLNYSWEKGANDTDLVNGTQTLTASGWFQAQGTSVTLHGTVSQLITALVRWPKVATLDDVMASAAGKLKIINDPGILVGMRSPNGKILRLEGVDDNMAPLTKIIDLTA